MSGATSAFTNNMTETMADAFDLAWKELQALQPCLPRPCKRARLAHGWASSLSNSPTRAF